MKSNTYQVGIFKADLQRFPLALDIVRSTRASRSSEEDVTRLARRGVPGTYYCPKVPVLESGCPYIICVSSAIPYWPRVVIPYPY
jgi:hypothetical protein